MSRMNIDDRRATRLKLVDEHIRLENQHDLNGIMGTFGETAHYDDEPWDAHYNGRDQVLTYYEGLLQALPGAAYRRAAPSCKRRGRRSRGYHSRAAFRPVARAATNRVPG